MDTVNTSTDPNPATATEPVVDNQPVKWEEQAKLIAQELFPCIAKHQTPAEAGASIKIQAILGTQPDLLVGLMQKNLFDTGETQDEKNARIQKLQEIDASREALRKQMETLNDERKKYELEETPKEEAVREILEGSMLAFLQSGNYVSNRLANFYAPLGLDKPEPAVKRGAKPTAETKNGVPASTKNDLMHVSTHAAHE